MVNAIVGHTKQSSESVTRTGAISPFSGDQRAGTGQRCEQEKTARGIRQEGEGTYFLSLPLLLLFSCCRCLFVCLFVFFFSLSVSPTVHYLNARRNRRSES